MREKLCKLLLKYEHLFDVTLGAWQTEPVDFELKEGSTFHSQRYYPVPDIYKETFKKEYNIQNGDLQPSLLFQRRIIESGLSQILEDSILK